MKYRITIGNFYKADSAMITFLVVGCMVLITSLLGFVYNNYNLILVKILSSVFLLIGLFLIFIAAIRCHRLFIIFRYGKIEYFEISAIFTRQGRFLVEKNSDLFIFIGREISGIEFCKKNGLVHDYKYHSIIARYHNEISDVKNVKILTSAKSSSSCICIDMMGWSIEATK